MSELADFLIADRGSASREAVGRGFRRSPLWRAYIRALPYGRAENASDVLAVLKEGVGTCSGRHRLLAGVAQACVHADVELGVGIYAMDKHPTPAVEPVR